MCDEDVAWQLDGFTSLCWGNCLADPSGNPSGPSMLCVTFNSSFFSSSGLQGGASEPF